MEWARDRSLTLVLLAAFLVFLIGQFVTGFYTYNATRRDHGAALVTTADYFATGHPWEAVVDCGWPRSCS